MTAGNGVVQEFIVHYHRMIMIPIVPMNTNMCNVRTTVIKKIKGHYGKKII